MEPTKDTFDARAAALMTSCWERGRSFDMVTPPLTIAGAARPALGS